LIQIAAYRGKSLVSKLIRWQTRSIYSHIAVRFADDVWVKLGDREKYIHAGNVIEAWQKGGVALHGGIGTVHTPGTRVDYYDFVTPLTDYEFHAVAGFLIRQLGKAYDWRAVVRFLTREPVEHWTRRRWFCSELAFEACLTAGRNLLERTDAWRVPPDWLPRSPLLKSAGHEITR
jgi:hypothetical protein